jgi:pilus assembly protein CpaC
LNFKPTIIDEDHIRLELEPEVSTIDFANGVRFNGFVIPALKTRRAKTGVELRDGQSFALAGLLDNNETHSLSQIPGLANIPILGNLFKSKSFQKQETELMFIVTADLVKPINRDELPTLKGVDNLKTGSPLLGVEPKDGGISGVSGFSTAPVPTAQENAPATASPATAAPAVSAPAVEKTSAPTPNGPGESEKKTASPSTAAVPATATKGNTPQ